MWFYWKKTHKKLIKLKINVKNIHAIDKRKDRIKEVKLGIEQTYNNLNTAQKIINTMRVLYVHQRHFI